MGPVLVVLFLIVPIAELAVILRASDAFGFGNTLGVLVLISILGAWLVKREGLGVWRRVQAQIEAGRVPAKELVDGVMVLFAGALLLTPGFLTDIVGLLLLLPPVRAVLRRFVRTRAEARVTVFGVGPRQVVDTWGTARTSRGPQRPPSRPEGELDVD